MLLNSAPIFRLVYFPVALFALALSSQTSFAQNRSEDRLENSVSTAPQQLQRQAPSAQPPAVQQQAQTNQKTQATTVACESDWRAFAPFSTAIVLAIGWFFTIRQIGLYRRARVDENKTEVLRRLVKHNKLILDDKGARSAVASLEGLRVPTDEAGADIYWAFRGVHLSHINLIRQVWELAGAPKEKNLDPGYEGWQRFAKEIVAKKLYEAFLATGEDARRPENMAGADLWRGLAEYEATSPKLFRWFQWLVRQ